MGFEDEVEQSIGRPCRQLNGRSKRHCELTSSIVPRGTSFHRRMELEFPPIGFDPVRLSCCCRGLFPCPAELGAVNPDAVHDHSQSAREIDERLAMHAQQLEEQAQKTRSLIGRLKVPTYEEWIAEEERVDAERIAEGEEPY